MWGAMLSFEDRFRAKHPDYRIHEEVISPNLSRFHLYVGVVHCSDSGYRDYAFRWALDDEAQGKLEIPKHPYQMELWPLED